MIVQQANDRLLLITQHAHSRVAGQIMAHSAALADHPRRGSVLLAVTEHDIGWVEEDAAPRIDPDTRTIVDFVSAPREVKHSVWPRAVGHLASEPWSAALIAQHAITVYDRFRSDPAWTDFFASMHELREGMRSADGGSLDDLYADYVFVRLGDLISLSFCTGWTDAHRYDRWSVRRVGSHVQVSPDLFGGATIEFEVGAVSIPARPYASGLALAEALRHEEREVLRGTAGFRVA